MRAITHEVSQRWRLVGVLIVVGLTMPGRAADGDDITTQAVAGEPFGVAKVTFAVPAKQWPFRFAEGDFQLVQKAGRALYVGYREPYSPYYDQADGDQESHFYFLFTGKEPFEITFSTPAPRTVTVKPETAQPGDKSHANLLKDWWQAFTSRPSFQYGDAADVSPMVDNYLASMLARRLKIDYHHANYGGFWGHDLDHAVGLLLGTESIRAAMQKERMLNVQATLETANQPLPKGATPPALELPRTPDDVAIEPLAGHVPHEAFYFRFGSFENFQWFRATLDDWGSDLRNLTSVRGVDYGIGPRLEQQLALKETVLSKIFGPQVIEDVAIVGFDTFVREGSSLGILFQAKNSLLLGTSLTQQRAEALAQPNVREEKIQIAGRMVSCIASPDQRVRSFYASDGDYHLVTNSKQLVRRFFEAGAGTRSLAAAQEFKVARMMFPLATRETAFIYLSDEFFRNLVGPRYRVEMTRRMHAQTDLELIALAKLAARAEGKPGGTIAELIAAELLPANFGARVDGSRAIADGDRYVDSLRGARGTFLPTADVEIEKVTPAEANAYAEFAEFYRSQWERVDPVAVSVRKEAGTGPRREKITLDIHIAPFAKARYGFLTGYLPPASKEMLPRLPDDLMSLQIWTRDFWNANNGAGLLFGALRDHAGPFVVRYGHIAPPDLDRAFAETPWYFGGSKQGIARWLFGTDKYEFDDQGFSKKPPEKREPWVAQTADFLVFSSQRKLLETVRPQLKTVTAERPAQLRLHVGDLSTAKMAPLVNAETYLRGLRASHSNTRFLHELSLQFPIPRADCRAVAEQLLGGKLVCSLGGEYRFVPRENQPGQWTSSLAVEVREGETFKLPAGYQPPPMNWFRGADLEFSLGTMALDARVELHVERKAP